MKLKENWCTSFALVFLIGLVVWVVLDYLHTGKIDFRFVLIGILGFSVGWSIANKKKKKSEQKPLYKERSHRLLFPTYFKIYENKIEAYFWPFKYEIPLSDVKDIEIIEKIPWYIGWGLRIHPWKRRLYFAIHHGKSVKIEKENGFWREIVLSVKNPEKFVSTLERLRK